MHTTTPTDQTHHHDKQYSKIFGHLLAVAEGYNINSGPLYTKQAGGLPFSGSQAFWEWLYKLSVHGKAEDLQKLMFTAYSKEVKGCRTSPDWSTNLFAHYPAGMPDQPGTYLLKTSSGYVFTGSSLGGLFSSTKDSRSSGQPGQAVVTLGALARDFEQVVNQGFKSLLREHSRLSAKGKLNLWLLRECSKPDVLFDLRPLGTFPNSISPDNINYVIQLMETIDTIYNGTIMNKEYGSNEHQASRDLAMKARSGNLPELHGKGANRALACYASQVAPDDSPEDPSNDDSTVSAASESTGSSAQLSHKPLEEFPAADRILPTMMVLGF